MSRRQTLPTPLALEVGRLSPGLKAQGFLRRFRNHKRQKNCDLWKKEYPKTLISMPKVIVCVLTGPREEA